MPGACTICMAIYGNGATIGMVPILPGLWLIRRAPYVGMSAWSAVAVMKILRPIAGRRHVILLRNGATSTWAFASYPPDSRVEFIIPFKLKVLGPKGVWYPMKLWSNSGIKERPKRMRIQLSDLSKQYWINSLT